MVANREYKDSVFRMLFTVPQNAVALYEWLTQKKFLPEEELFIDEKGGLFTTELNHDVAFRVANKLFFVIEHQSTVNENMPIRMLLAIAELYRRYLKLFGTAIYGSCLLLLPAVEPYVLYNGKRDEPARREMRLSVAFGDNDNGKLELKVTLINLRHKDNAGLLKRCEPLAGYSRFVYEVENNRKTMELGAAIRRAIEVCKGENILTDFFAANEEEVRIAMVMEYNREDEMAQCSKEAREAGRAEGRIENIVDSIRSLMKTLNFTAEKAMDALQIPVSDRAKYLAAI